MDVTSSAGAALAHRILQAVNFCILYYIYSFNGYFPLISPQLSVVKLHLMEKNAIL